MCVCFRERERERERVREREREKFFSQLSDFKIEYVVAGIFLFFWLDGWITSGVERVQVDALKNIDFQIFEIFKPRMIFWEQK